jgi:hypothetical protein
MALLRGEIIFLEIGHTAPQKVKIKKLKNDTLQIIKKCFLIITFFWGGGG